MFRQLLYTDNEHIYLFLRLAAGIIIFPYGMHKLFGWFLDPGLGPRGINETLRQMKEKRLPRLIGWLVLLGQSVGSIALITGFLGRVAAAGNFIIFTGALIVHLPEGWTLN